MPAAAGAAGLEEALNETQSEGEGLHRTDEGEAEVLLKVPRPHHVELRGHPRQKFAKDIRVFNHASKQQRVALETELATIDSSE